MPIKQHIIDNLEQLKAWRHWLHQQPEIAFKEEQTASFVEQKLKAFLAPNLREAEQP